MASTKQAIEKRLGLLEKEVALTRQDVKYVVKFIEEDRQRFKEHLETSEEYRTTVDELRSIPKVIKDHGILDLWLFGGVGATQIWILTMLWNIKP